MSLYGLPRFVWRWEHDKIIEQHASNVDVRLLIQDAWPDEPVPNLHQIKHRRQVLKHLRSVNEFRAKNGEPPLERPHSPKPFDESLVHLLGTKPDALLAQQLGFSPTTVRMARLERRILSYQETRHSSYDPEMEDDMLKTVKAIAFFLPDNTLDKACSILHKIDPVWIKQCLDRLEREQNVGTTDV